MATARKKLRSPEGAAAPPPATEACPQARGEPVVQAVMSATLAELTRAGFGALRVEDVAAAAGVNKTTVYRRWPTKAELVRDALLSIPERLGSPPDTGAVRSDLIAFLSHVLRTLRSFEGEGVVRMMFAERADPELARIIDGIRAKKERVPLAIVKRAVARGELPAHVDPRILLAVLVGTFHHEIFMRRSTPDASFTERLVDFVLAGAVHAKAPSQTKAAPRPRRVAVAVARKRSSR